MSLISKMDLLNKRRVAWIDGLKTTYVTTSDIFDAPEIDAAPVVHAQFKKSIERDEWWGYIYVCSECGAEMMVYNAENDCVPPEYCANCGARMDAETE